VKGSICDQILVRKTMKNVDAVIHEAALINMQASIQNPLLTNEINVSGTLNMLKVALDSGIKRFVFASSAAVYSESENPCKIETENSNPKTPYGVTKLVNEKYAKSFYLMFGLETVGLRYFNVFGPGQSCDLQAQYGGVISIFLNRLLRDMPPIIYGDGEQTRDFVYVEDIAEANMCALKSRNVSGDVFNVGSGKEVSINYVASILKKLLKKQKIQNIYSDSRPGDVKRGYADITKARSLLGLSLRYSFEEGMCKLLDQSTKSNH
jgi:nucleoside-diphosphate-sugar epimerase